MKEAYIRQVERALPRGKRKEVVRDLQEAFASGAEHGESAEQVIQRLGTPQEFVRELQEAEAGYGPDPHTGRGRRPGLALPLATWAVAGVCIAASLAAGRLAVPDGVIGQANAMTNIQVEGAFPLSLSQLLLAAGLATAAAAIVLTAVCILRRRKGGQRKK